MSDTFSSWWYIFFLRTKLLFNILSFQSFIMLLTLMDSFSRCLSNAWSVPTSEKCKWCLMLCSKLSRPQRAERWASRLHILCNWIWLFCLPCGCYRNIALQALKGLVSWQSDVTTSCLPPATDTANVGGLQWTFRNLKNAWCLNMWLLT